MTHPNLNWAKEYARSIDQNFKFRWEIYDDLLSDHLKPETNWLDIGCGCNSDIVDFGQKIDFACGIDLIKPEPVELPFVQGDIYHLPFSAQTFDLITLRFVVEHLEFPQEAFAEMHRILKPGGRILIMTTNLSSPFISLPRILPFKLKQYLLEKIFGGHHDDIFPTFHKLNRYSDYQKLTDNFIIERFDYIQDTNISRRWLFKLLFRLGQISESWRINLIATLRKK